MKAILNRTQVFYAAYPARSSTSPLLWCYKKVSRRLPGCQLGDSVVVFCSVYGDQTSTEKGRPAGGVVGCTGAAFESTYCAATTKQHKQLLVEECEATPGASQGARMADGSRNSVATAGAA